MHWNFDFLLFIFHRNIWLFWSSSAFSITQLITIVCDVFLYLMNSILRINHLCIKCKILLCANFVLILLSSNWTIFIFNFAIYEVGFWNLLQWSNHFIYLFRFALYDISLLKQWRRLNTWVLISRLISIFNILILIIIKIVLLGLR